MPEVRVIDENGNQAGVMRTEDALRYAQQRDLDLVEVAATARPPVCRVLDYSKYKYEQAQKKKTAKKHQTQVVTREIKFRPKIADHDYATKKGHVIRFLKGKDKVKVTIMFRGREVTHPERGRDLLERLVIDLDDICQVDQRPSLEGRNMTMMLSPSKEVINGTWAPKVPPTEEELAAEAEAEDNAGIVVGGEAPSDESTDDAAVTADASADDAPEPDEAPEPDAAPTAADDAPLEEPAADDAAEGDAPTEQPDEAPVAEAEPVAETQDAPAS
ncbi:translation initiation factor IF-3 [Patulibacter sp.]|uniref:translation initiation factor IF-3 n=1 Tax=Patulibacter sp. TaxID=1912859 RepID=UPI00351EF914